METLRLIVNADDFGLSERVNEGIVQAHRRGIVTSASLMAPGDAVEHAIALAKATPTLDVGVHLTVIEEQPISPPDVVPTLVAANGRFHPHAMAFMRRYFLGRISLEQIRREFDAQIDYFVSRGLRVSHLDGHQHLHMVPAVRLIVGQLAQKYAIHSIRWPSETPRIYMLKESVSLRRIPEMILLKFFCALAGTSDARRPDYFCGFFYGGRLTKQNLLRVLTHLPSTGICEVMCHPGLIDPGSRHDHWGYQWQAECDALTDNDVVDFIKRKGIQLISYSDLRGQT